MQNINSFTFFLGTQINSLTDLLMLVYLKIEACMKSKHTKISEDIAH